MSDTPQIDAIGGHENLDGIFEEGFPKTHVPIQMARKLYRDNRELLRTLSMRDMEIQRLNKMLNKQSKL